MSSDALGPSTGRADQQERLFALLEPVVQGVGLVLEEVGVSGEGGRRTLQVLVDLPEDRTDGVTLDDITRASQAVSQELDRADAVDGPGYELEVSSPGADRPLLRPRHWRRSVGRLVLVHPVDRTEHGRSFEARLLEAGDDAAVLQRGVQPKKGMPVRLLEPETWPYATIRQARVQVEG